MIIRPEDFAIHEPDDELLKIINEKEFKDRILYEKKSDFHDIKVIENEIGRFLHFKDTYQAGFIDTPDYKGNLPYINYFTIPYLINSAIKSILVIGFGTGRIVNDFEVLFDGLECIDAVDIEENIFDIAQKFFNYKKSAKVNLILQDGLVYLRTCRKKYDLIVVDVASDEGIDDRFLENEYFDLIKNCLTKDGIFVSNLCASPDFENPKNKLFKRIKEIYGQNFQNNLIFKGNTSDLIYYKAFFGLNERVIDTTNVILTSGNKNIKIRNISEQDKYKYTKIDIDITKFIDDIYETGK